MNKLAIISDIHGCFDTLMSLIDKLPADVEIMFCGDLIDRGPNSKAVVDYAMNNNIMTVMGNHEHLMLFHYGYNKDYTHPEIWLMNGGLNCLHSFGGKVPTSVQLWAKNLPIAIIREGLLISHTGHGTDKNSFNAVWRRDRHFPDDGLFRVFGHTQEQEPVIRNHYAMIDTGAAYKSKGFGKLTAFLWPSKEIIQVETKESKVKLDQSL